MAVRRHRTGLYSAQAAVVITDHGEHDLDSGGTSDTHTYNSKSTTGTGRAYVLLTWHNTTATTRDVSSITWGGTAADEIVVQQAVSVGETLGCGIFAWDGAQASGNIVITFSGVITDSHMTIVSTDNEYAGTEDTDTQGAASPITMSGLVAPSSGGARLVVANYTADTVAASFGNATEIADLDAGSHRHCAATDEDTNTSDITVTGSGNVYAVGASIR